MKAKMEVKRVLNQLWHLGKCSDIYMFHHVTMTPAVERSCCKLDTQYIGEWSVKGDISILFKTVMGVLKNEGAV